MTGSPRVPLRDTAKFCATFLRESNRRSAHGALFSPDDNALHLDHTGHLRDHQL
jgi:hypothetical protein